MFRKCLPYLYVKSVCSDEYQYAHHNITTSFFVDKKSNFQCTTNFVSLGYDHIMIDQYCIKYNYISHVKITNNSFYLFIYGEIKQDKQKNYCDKPMFIKLIFSSHLQSYIFNENIIAIINKYKLLNLSDNSSSYFTSFKLKN